MRLTVAASLGPNVFWRDWTSAASRPLGLAASRKRSRSTGSFQNSSAPISSTDWFIMPSIKAVAPMGASGAGTSIRRPERPLQLFSAHDQMRHERVR